MKTILIILSSTIILFFISCADKVPFKEQTPLSNSALVYLYANQVVLSENGSTIGKFKLMVNDKSIGITLVENEYTAIDLKPQKVILSATKGALITKEITLDLKIGGVYYLKAEMLIGDDFKFEKVSKSVAMQEIVNTKLHGSVVQDKINALVKVEEKSTIEKSKVDQIKDANQLKIDGIITQEEFEKLKADILDAD